MADHVQQVSSNFETNQQLQRQAQNFGKFLNVRSQFDQQYLSQYDPLSFQADTGPSDLLKRVPNWVTGTSSIVEGYCGDAVFTAEQNVQKPIHNVLPVILFIVHNRRPVLKDVPRLLREALPC